MTGIEQWLPPFNYESAPGNGRFPLPEDPPKRYYPEWSRGYTDGQTDVVNFFVRADLAHPDDGPMGQYIDGQLRGELALWCLGHNLAVAGHMFAVVHRAERRQVEKAMRFASERQIQEFWDRGQEKYGPSTWNRDNEPMPADRRDPGAFLLDHSTWQLNDVYFQDPIGPDGRRR